MSVPTLRALGPEPPSPGPPCLISFTHSPAPSNKKRGKNQENKNKMNKINKQNNKITKTSSRLASLRVCVELLSNPLLGLASSEETRQEKLSFYRDLCSKASLVFEAKLWNGKYFDYDSSSSGHHDSIMADQLCGETHFVRSFVCSSVFSFGRWVIPLA